MQLQRLESVDAFVVRDLEGVPAAGVVRSAPKILTDGATWLARSMTYRFASFERRAGGASAGVNARPDDRAAAIASFASAVEADVAAGELLLEPGKGIDADGAAVLRAGDPRPDDWWAAHHDLTAAGVLAGLVAVGGADGTRVVLEGVDAMAPALHTALVGQLLAGGARIVAVSTASGGAVAPDGFDVERLETALGADEPEVGAEVALAAEADALLAGSRAGVISHELARELAVRTVVGWGPLPVTAKALAELGRAGCVVQPDFVTTAGPSIVDPAGPLTDAPAAVASAVAAVLAEVADHEHGPLLGACLRAEAFLASWTAERPFGRPIA